MKRYLIFILLFLLLFTGCNKNSEKDDNKEEHQKINEKSIENMVLIGKMDTYSSNSYEDDYNCFDNVYDTFWTDGNSKVIIHNDGSICLYNFKPFYESKKNTIKLNDTINGEILYIMNNKIFLKDGTTVQLDKNNNLIYGNVYNTIDNTLFQIANKYEKCFLSDYFSLYCLNSNDIALIKYDFGNYIEEPIVLNIELDDDETIENMYSYGRLIKTNKKYYIKTMTNLEDYKKYNNVIPEYKYIQLIDDDFYNKIGYIDLYEIGVYIYMDNNIYNFEVSYDDY